LGWVNCVHVKVNFLGEPVLVDFAEDGEDEAKEGGFVEKEGGDAGSACDFLVEAFKGVGG
jgi:hypothetical protein